MIRHPKTLVYLAACALVAFAVDAAAAENAQQTKMTTCNAEAKSKHMAGDDRKAFMKSCLSAAPAPAVNSQQQKMKDCNANAKTQGLSGDARKQFMSGCLKGS